MVRRSRSSIEITSWLTLTGFGSSGWRRANASRRWVRAAPRLADVGAKGASRATPRMPSLSNAFRHQIERTDHACEQVVEIVRNAASELTDRFHLLRLAKLL